MVDCSRESRDESRMGKGGTDARSSGNALELAMIFRWAGEGGRSGPNKGANMDLAVVRSDVTVE